MRFRVLFFDSGVGGLSVFRDVMQNTTFDISPIYLFDNDYCPYGNKDKEFIRERVVFLLKKAHEKFNLDLIVIACNTASTVALESVRKVLDIPIVGVVPAIKPAAQMSKNKIIGLLATPMTISMEYTKILIEKYAQNVKVECIGSTILVKLAEQKISGVSYNKDLVKQELMPWINLDKKPDVIVLGCTHFPHLRDDISILFPNSQIIDSGKAIARRVEFLLSTMQSIKEKSEPKAFCTNKLKITEELERSFSGFGFCEIIDLLKF